MKRMLYIGILLIVAVARGSVRGSTDGSKPPDFAALKAFAYQGKWYVVYGDTRGIVHVSRKDSAEAVEEWESRPLESAIAGIFCDDLDKDGVLEALAYTGTGAIALFNIEALRRIWNNNPGEFSTITCMTVANVDADPQKEIIFCADSHLYIYDSKTQFREWESNEEFEAQDIEIGDADDDGQLELILNTGYVLDTKFHDVEWQTEKFGDQIALFDVDEDGILELIGEFSNHVIKVFDMDLRREKW